MAETNTSPTEQAAAQARDLLAALERNRNADRRSDAAMRTGLRRLVEHLEAQALVEHAFEAARNEQHVALARRIGRLASEALVLEGAAELLNGCHEYDSAEDLAVEAIGRVAMNLRAVAGGA